jgi:hypothetical protein
MVTVGWALVPTRYVNVARTQGAPYAPRLPICWQNGAVQRFAVSAPEEAKC